MIQDVARWQQIIPQWEALCHAAPSVTPFQLPIWQLTWWAHFGSGELHVFAFWRNDELAGIVPCFLHQWNERNQLTLIGSGISDYLEPVFRAGETTAIIAQLEAHLKTNNAWQVCHWQDLNAGSPCCGLQSSVGFQVNCEPDTPCAEIPLTGNFEDFWNARPKDLRRNMRRYTERALASGPIDFEVVDQADSELLYALIALHALRWQKRGEAGMIASNNSTDFLKDIAPKLGRRGLFRFFVLRYQRNIAAIIWTMPFQKKIFSYLSALDPEHEIYGFGRTLLFEAIRHSYGQKLSAWNFMRGDEPYKFSWGGVVVPKLKVCITR